jgi:hypothetical protein
MVARPSWIDTAKGATVEAVAGELGLDVRRRAFGPCPACGAERRGGGDRRPPCGIGEGWRCFACKVAGDALDLVARVVAGARLRELTLERMAEVRAWYAARGWCDPALGGPAAPVVARRAPAAPAEPAPVYPPVAEVAALWSACAALTDVPWGYRGDGRWADPAVPWLEKRRGLSCRELGALDLARLLPLDPDAHPWPSWIPRLGMGRAEWLQLYRLAVPMYDATGALRSLRFRAVTDVCEPTADGLRWRALDVKGHQKALAATGSTVRGLTLADPVGRALLAGELASAPWDGRVVVTEGEPDLWTWSTRKRRGMAPNALTWAVLGVVSGSWTDDLAARVPSGCKVSVLTDNDPAGDKYAERIRRTLAKRCEVRRGVIPGEREED